MSHLRRSGSPLRKADIRDLVDHEGGTLCSSIFTDPDIYQLELSQIFRRSWQVLGFESQIPRAGDYFTNYLADDHVIVQRTLRGEIVAMLNQCRHRGNALCRSDAGNARAWRCPYHSWVYDTEGRLKGVPREIEGYSNQLDKSAWGLIHVPRLEVFLGIIFANWDPDAPPLREQLGEGAIYALETLFSMAEEGMEAISVSRWTIQANWKWQVDQHVWDSYHFAPSHASTLGLPLMTPQGKEAPIQAIVDADIFPEIGVSWSSSEFGHGGNFAVGMPAFPGGTNGAEDRLGEPDRVMRQVDEEVRARAAARLDAFRAQTTGIIMALFPNTGINNLYLRTWLPRGPTVTECRNYIYMARNASPEEKQKTVEAFSQSFGNSGIYEQDDVETLRYCQIGVTGNVARKTRLNMQMGMHHDRTILDIAAAVPQATSMSVFSEQGARDFYQHWSKCLLTGVEE